MNASTNKKNTLAYIAFSDLFLCNDYEAPQVDDHIGLQQARKYGLEKEYEEARNYGLTVLEALEKWNLIDDDFISKFGHFEDIKKPERFKNLKKAWRFIESLFSR